MQNIVLKCIPIPASQRLPAPTTDLPNLHFARSNFTEVIRSSPVEKYWLSGTANDPQKHVHFGNQVSKFVSGKKNKETLGEKYLCTFWKVNLHGLYLQIYLMIPRKYRSAAK